MRRYAHNHPMRIVLTVLAALVIGQFFLDESFYHRLSVFLIFTVFAFKSWANLIFSITTRRQEGNTDLSRAMEKYFVALFSQSVIFSVLFLVAFIDLAGAPLWGMEWIVVRNMLRTIAIATVVGVIIYGDVALDALLDEVDANRIALLKRIHAQ